MPEITGRGPSCALCGRTEPLRVLSSGEQVCADSEACVQAVIESAQVAGRTLPYDRDVLAEVVVCHHKVRIEGCLCGWSDLGRCIGEHVADVYEASVAARHG